MENRFDLKYGDTALEVTIPREVTVQCLNPRPLSLQARQCAEAPMVALEQALDNPIGTSRLEEIVRVGETCGIVVSDITRLWAGTKYFLPSIIRRLNHAGIRDDDITVFLARGTHRVNSVSEIRQIIGDDLASRLKVVQHDPDGPCTFVGTTSRGTKVELNSQAMACDRLILTGGLVHHAMAGYGGGRKSIIPGIASRSTVRQNHLWVIDPKRPAIRRGAGSARTTGNPLHEDMMEAAALAGIDFLVNATTDASGRFAGFFAGHWEHAWRKGCELIDSTYCVSCTGKADTVIASCGGYPRDISMYQASKAFYNAWMAANPGGTIVMVCEARDGGGGEEFFSWFDYPTIEECHKALVADFTIAGYLAFLVYLVATQHRVMLVTDLPQALVEQMHMTRVFPSDIQLVIDTLRLTDSVTIMPEAAITLPSFS